jgi:hypothetical protein
MCLTPSSTPALQSAALAESRNTSSASLALVAGANGDDNLACDSCMASRRELDYFKSLIGHLQRKLGALEENHEKTKKEHQNVNFFLISLYYKFCINLVGRNVA